MKCLVSKILLIFCLLSEIGYGFTLDTSVDDKIRKNYNPSKLEEDALPPLPKTITSPIEVIVPDYEKTNVTTKPIQTQTPVKKEVINSQTTVSKPTINNPVPQKVTSGQFAVIKKGTKFKTKLLTDIFDTTRNGAGFTLVNLYPVSTTYLTIPRGALLKGKVVKAHTPQLSGNGSLIVMNINSVTMNGQKYLFDAKITKLNNKKIFFNNIKGKRKYISNSYKSTKWGRTYFKKMCKVSGDLLDDGGTIILSPFPILIGTLSVGANFIASPVIGLFTKGLRTSVPSGTIVEIKLNNDVIIYN